MTTPHDRNFVDELIDATRHRLDEPFLAVPGLPAVSYGAYWERVSLVAAALSNSGALPGDRVVVQVEKSVDAVVLYAACLHAGTVHVPLNPAFTDDEVDYFITDASPAIVVVDPERATDLASRHAVTVLGLGADGTGSLIEAANAATPSPPVPRAGTDLAALLYTSGTTGQPKGASLSHTNLRLNGSALHEAWHFDGSDHLVHSLPMFHVHGLFVALHCAMLSAIPVTFLPRFDAGEVIEAIGHATVFMGVPTHYGRLLTQPGFNRDACAGMRLFTAGSAPLTTALFDEFRSRTGHTICERYGMSETMITFSNPYDDARIAGTVGFPVPGVQARVTDAAGTPVATNTAGVVEVRGGQVMSEYWARPEATIEARRADGWFITGDIGSIDTEGRLTLQGRMSDMIISGGENVYPKEVELVLDAVPGVSESAVVGIPHPDFGEAVTAVIVDGMEPSDDAAITDALKSSLARFKHPKAVIRVDALPRNSMGKVQKKALREEHADLYSARS